MSTSWFLKLIPPRPTFDKDLNEAEASLMQQHFLYWKDLFERGICLFGGPVFDTRGTYGVLAVRTASVEEVQILADNDPSVKCGLNRFEIAEMKVTFLPATSRSV
jgi:uncharacterized protein YciI